ncbi:mannosyl-oligosaccharide 1-2-alpha-mannosidase [Apiospora kogelbergensis]|uniref:alpha-1,2-Mannosidase n=1 Tax=Apiospora kogelbergensis TaxID=1337665 RepID=A0AAW0Q6T3_9PEZI
MAQSKEARLRKSSRSPGTRIEPNSRDKETSALKTDRIRPSAPVTPWRFLRQKFALLALFASLLFYTFHWTKDNALGFSHYKPAALVDWDYRRDAVKQAFVTSWEGYNRDAWGKDIYKPQSHTGGYMSPKGLGWIIIDSLDTMMLMNLTEPLAEARKWLHRDLTWDQDQDVNTFEMTIRMMGGLLSAHYLSTRLPDVSSKRDTVYLAKATDLADRLLAGFESSSGIPYASVNLGTKVGIPSHADGGASSTAEAATVQLEMKYLSHLTGNNIYWRRAEKVLEVLDAQKMEGGLLPIFVHAEYGVFTTREIRLGSRGDSYYEYLPKQYLQTGEDIYLDMWDEALEGIKSHLITETRHSKLKFVAELPSGVGGTLSPKMDHLVCFLPGTIALGATQGRTLAEARKSLRWTEHHEEDMKLAAELMKTCWGMYAVTGTGLAPEIAWFEAAGNDLEPNPGSRRSRQSSNFRSWCTYTYTQDKLALRNWKKDFIIKPLDAHNIQRPETVESLFMMYRITGDSIYREWGWNIFQAFQEHTKTPFGDGYTSLDDVRTVPPKTRDNMESFWLAETLKYLYLLFSPEDYMPLTEVVFNTEAHPLPRFTPKGNMRTGWKRVPR